jgi:hypothetical protein
MIWGIFEVLGINYESTLFHFPISYINWLY